MKPRGLGLSTPISGRIETSVRFPEKVSKGIVISMTNGGYSVRERSKWISEAIATFYEKHDDETPPELSGTVSLFTADYPNKKSLPVIISNEGLSAFRKLIETLRSAPTSKFNPAKTQSDLILAACLNRLISERINILSI